MHSPLRIFSYSNPKPWAATCKVASFCGSRAPRRAHPAMLAGAVTVKPVEPADWPHASIPQTNFQSARPPSSPAALDMPFPTWLTRRVGVVDSTREGRPVRVEGALTTCEGGAAAHEELNAQD